MGKTEETFQNNNFAYTSDKNGVQVTLLENNYINPFRPNTYKATLVYLIRQQGELTIHTHQHVLGIFLQAKWDKVFTDAGLDMQQKVLDGIYNKYLLHEGEYPLTAFVGQQR